VRLSASGTPPGGVCGTLAVKERKISKFQEIPTNQQMSEFREIRRSYARDPCDHPLICAQPGRDGGGEGVGVTYINEGYTANGQSCSPTTAQVVFHI